MPARVKTAPRPQLKSGFSSSCVTADVAASRALLPLARRASVAARMERSALRYVAQDAVGRLAGVMLPAPPWMMMRGLVIVGLLGELWGIVEGFKLTAGGTCSCREEGSGWSIEERVGEMRGLGCGLGDLRCGVGTCRNWMVSRPWRPASLVITG